MDIKEIRKGMGLSQYDFAAILDVAQATVWNWERGLSKPRKAKVEKINQLIEDHRANRIPERQGTIKPYTPPKRAKIKLDVWPYRRK